MTVPQAKLTDCRRLLEIGAAVRQTFEPVILTHLYPRSEIAIQIQVLAADGGESREGGVGRVLSVTGVGKNFGDLGSLGATCRCFGVGAAMGSMRSPVHLYLFLLPSRSPSRLPAPTPEGSPTDRQASSLQQSTP